MWESRKTVGDFFPTLVLSRDMEKLEEEKEHIESRIDATETAGLRDNRAAPDGVLPSKGSLKRRLGGTDTGWSTKRQRPLEDDADEIDVLGDRGSMQTSVQHSEKSLEEQQADCQKALFDMISKVSNANRNHRKTETERKKVQSEYILAMKEKFVFCSLERSKHSRDIIIEDFRAGLRDLEDGENERKDYESVNPPVFTCSSRDFLRMTNPTDEGDGPTCFYNTEDTGIPALQRWCQRLTVASRERAARSFLARLLAFATSIQTYSRGIANVTVQDRVTLREKWESGDTGDADILIPQLRKSRYSIADDEKVSLTSGITSRLCQEISELVDVCVDSLKAQLRKGLSKKCKDGAAKASERAVATVDKFAASMAWNAYRATLVRDGVFHVDLNVALASPFTKVIARSWGSLFRKLSFRGFEDEVLKSISTLLQEVQDSATIGLQDRAKIQSEACLEEAKVMLKQCMHSVRATISDYQRTISRMMSPHVQKQLREGYKRAVTECGTGKGSSARRQALFRAFVDQNKERIFNQGSDIVTKSVDQGAEAIGDALGRSLGELAQRVEVNMSTLWEVYHDSRTQIRARKRVANVATCVCEQTGLWIEVARLKNEKDKLEYDTTCQDI